MCVSLPAWGSRILPETPRVCAEDTLLSYLRDSRNYITRPNISILIFIDISEQIFLYPQRFTAPRSYGENENTMVFKYHLKQHNSTIIG